MKTIAVIDDDIHIGNFLEELLQREGYAVLRAYSGTEAVLLLERNTDSMWSLPVASRSFLRRLLTWIFRELSVQSGVSAEFWGRLGPLRKRRFHLWTTFSPPTACGRPTRGSTP